MLSHQLHAYLTNTSDACVRVFVFVCMSVDEAIGVGSHSIVCQSQASHRQRVERTEDGRRRRRMFGLAVASRDLPDLFFSVCQLFLSADGGETGVVITALVSSVVITALVSSGSLTSAQQQALF